MLSAPANSGTIETLANHAVDQVEKLKNVRKAKGVKLFALIDHNGEERKWA
jgi:5S rRNA maturation endonuclease (ribonuclease M5)